MEKILTPAGIVPIITPTTYEQTRNMVQALTDGGITTIEIVLRTPVAIEVLAKIAGNFRDCVVGAGTVITATQMEECQAAGAQFIVTPGNTDKLLQKAQDLKLPILPGAACASDILRALEYDIQIVKLFPANLVGGLNAIRAFTPVFPQVKFCPTGGLNLENIACYYQMKNVIAVGGSWLTPAEIILSKNWAKITKLAQMSLSLLKLHPH